MEILESNYKCKSNPFYCTHLFVNVLFLYYVNLIIDFLMIIIILHTNNILCKDVKYHFNLRMNGKFQKKRTVAVCILPNIFYFTLHRTNMIDIYGCMSETN